MQVSKEGGTYRPTYFGPLFRPLYRRTLLFVWQGDRPHPAYNHDLVDPISFVIGSVVLTGGRAVTYQVLYTPSRFLCGGKAIIARLTFLLVRLQATGCNFKVKIKSFTRSDGNVPYPPTIYNNRSVCSSNDTPCVPQLQRWNKMSLHMNEALVEQLKHIEYKTQIKEDWTQLGLRINKYLTLM